MNYADRVKEATTTTGTGPLVLAGAPAGFRSFAAALSVNSTVPYCISSATGAEWEVGIGTLTDATHLTRTLVLSSSNGGALVNFSAGAKDVFCTMPADTLRRGIVDSDDLGFDIVLCAGQSNMEGNPASDPLIDIGDSRMYQFAGSSSDAATYRKIITGADPLYMYNGPRTGKTGPATWFGKAYLSTVPNNRRVLLVPVAAGSTGLIGSFWQSGNPGGTLYELAIAQSNLAITAAQAWYPNSRFVGVIWAQGEADAGQTQAAYAAGFKAVIAGFRSRIAGAANSWFVISGMVPEYVAANPSFGVIDLAHRQVASETDRCAYVPGATGYANDVHYTAPGVRVMGSRLGLAVRAASVYSATDTTPPAAISADVANATPTKVVVTMTEPIDAAYVPAASAFSVSGHIVSGVAIGGNTITLTVDAFVYGETRTVAYTQPGTNNVRDLAGNLLSNFSGLSITNNVAAAASAVTMTGPSSGVVGTASGNFTVGVSPVGGTITGTVVVTPSDGGAGGTFTPTTVSLSNGSPTGTFKYTAASAGAKTISATNNGGLANPSNITYTASAAPTVPDAPTIGTATAGDASASVAFTAPGNNGGSPITGYTVTSTPGGITATGASSPINVTGLTNGTAYTFTVRATNAIGNSAESAASNSVTPASAGATYATWNPSDKNAAVGLSNGNLTMTKTGGVSGFASARSTVGKSSGKWYWENTVQAAGSWMIGIAKIGATLTDFIGKDANGWGYYSPSGVKYTNNASGAYGAAYAVGDIIGVALDMTAGTAEFFKNGVSQGVAYTGLTGTIYAANTVNAGTPAGAITTNFGASAFTYVPPSGFTGLSA